MINARCTILYHNLFTHNLPRSHKSAQNCVIIIIVGGGGGFFLTWPALMISSYLLVYNLHKAKKYNLNLK